MPLKVIGAGYGRTGTMSTYTALNLLGFPCYHMIEVLQKKENAAHLDFWRRVAHLAPGSQADWEQVFARYAACVDNPAAPVWRELMEAYPEAKVLLTLHPRGADAWYESTIDTIYLTESMWQFRVLRMTTRFGRKFGDMSHRLIWQRGHRGTMRDRTAAIAEYHRHVEEVKAAVPPDRLLVFRVDEGWEPLCAFLGVPVPDVPFPNVNDRKEIKKTIAAMTKGAYTITAAAAVGFLILASGIGYGLAGAL